MRDYEEKSYYEIQLDNKQLILVFLAGVTVCVLVFILGVMVGKGRKEAEIAAIKGNSGTQTPIRPEPDLEPPQEIQAATPATNQKKNKKEKEVEPKQEDIDYAYTELDNTDTEKPLVKEPSKTAKDETKAKEETKAAAKKETKVEPKLAEKKSEPVEKKAEPEQVKAVAETVQAPVDESGRYTVQVMATASKPKAEAQLAALQQKGYTAYMNEEQAAGSAVFKVRVGKFSDADTARKTAARLKQELRLETWVAVLD